MPFIYFACILAAAVILVFSTSQFWLASTLLRTGPRQKQTPTSATDVKAWPTVLVQLPIYNESSVVEQLLEAISKLDYPREKISVQLLDDSNDETTEIAAHKIAQIMRTSKFSIAHIRRDSRQGFKAGALHYGLELDANKSEFVAIFDADFTPRADFLRQTIPHFLDAGIGMVQTRWIHKNENESIITSLMALAIDNHFVVEHGGRQAAGCFINFNGTAGVWRTAAITSAGGWADDSLTEDLDLSMRCQMAGWRCLYLRDIGTPSELPSTLSSLRTQQFRWTKGAAEAALKLGSPLLDSSATKTAKLIGMLQLWASVVFPATLLFGIAALGYHFLDTTAGLQVFFISSIGLLLATFAITFSYVTSQWILGKRAWPEIFINILKTQAFTLFALGFSIQNTWAV